MCCSVDYFDVDIFMMVLRCIPGKNKKLFVARVFIGLVFDICESLSIAFYKTDNATNIILLVLAAALCITLFIFIYLIRREDEKEYYYTYVFLFKFVSLAVAVIVFNGTSNFDPNTIEQLYIHFADGNFKDMFLSAVNFISILDMILNSISLILLIWKFHRDDKNKEDDMSCELLDTPNEPLIH